MVTMLCSRNHVANTLLTITLFMLMHNEFILAEVENIVRQKIDGVESQGLPISSSGNEKPENIKSTLFHNLKKKF